MASSDDENESMEVDSKPKKSNFRKIIDSDNSDEEKSEMKDSEGNSSDEKIQNVNKGRKQLQSDSSDDDRHNRTTNSDKINESGDPEESLKKSTNQKSKLYDTDSSDDEPDKSLHNKTSDDSKNLDESLNESGISIKQKSKLIDSDSDEEPQEKPTENRRKGVPKKFDKKPKEKPQRKSAKAAMETIKDELNIKELSEKQRADRDREIKIPYHKPKQYSLKEFLARRTLNKPTLPSSQQEPKSTILKMKMNSEDLEKFAQKMKKREEEAIEFFKSESEDEEMENPSDSLKETSEEVTKETIELTSDVPAVEKKPEMPHEIENVTTDQPIEDNQAEITEELQPESPGKENISEQIPSPLKKTKEHSALKTLDEMSGKDVTIDLTTGFIQPKVLKGPELLFNRYLKTISKPKHKDTVSMNILTVEDGKVENQRVEVKLDKKMELDHNRPGFSHELLKEKLRNQIVNKRLEEVRKKSLRKPEPIELEPEDKCETKEKEKTVKKDESSDDDYDPDNDSDEMDSDNEVEVKKKKREKSKFVDDEVSFSIIVNFRILNIMQNAKVQKIFGKF